MCKLFFQMFFLSFQEIWKYDCLSSPYLVSFLGNGFLGWPFDFSKLSFIQDFTGGEFVS